MGVPFCKVVDWFCEACAKLFMWRTRMNFGYTRLLTEFLMLLDEMDSTKFMFSCCVCISWVVLEKTGFSCKNRCLSVFANKWLRKVLGKWFWDGWNLNFSVGYDRVKCHERVGENGTEIRLTVWFLRAKWWKRKKWKICGVRRAQPCVYRHEPCLHSVFLGHGRVYVGTGRACWQDFGFCVFRAFSPIFVLNWPLT